MVGNLGLGGIPPAFQRAANDDSHPLIGLGNGGTLPPMDPWQASVEKRLDSLDGRGQRLESAVTDLRVDVASIKERVTHLPDKDWVSTKLRGNMVLGVALFGALVAAINLAIHFLN